MLQIIAVLLFLILEVMLNGADVVKNGIGVVSTIAIGAMIIIGVGKGIIEVLREAVDEAKNQGHAWRWKYPLVLGFTGVIAVYALAGFTAGTLTGKEFKSSMDAIPYWWAPFVLLGLSPIVRIVESAPKWIHEVPGAIGDFFVALGGMLVAPVWLPIASWSKIKADKADGVKIGFFASLWMMITSVFFGCCIFVVGAILAGLAIAASAGGMAALFQAMN